MSDTSPHRSRAAFEDADHIIHGPHDHSPRPAIPGTSIVLETDEDIARWIAERKARWPTSSRIAQKVQSPR